VFRAPLPSHASRLPLPRRSIVQPAAAAAVWSGRCAAVPLNWPGCICRLAAHSRLTTSRDAVVYAIVFLVPPAVKEFFSAALMLPLFIVLLHG
jgi:hypothetical protein